MKKLCNLIPSCTGCKTLTLSIMHTIHLSAGHVTRVLTGPGSPCTPTTKLYQRIVVPDQVAIPMAELFRRGLRLGPPGSEQVRGGRRRSPPNSISPRNKKFRRGIRRGLGGLPRNKFVPPRIRSDPPRIGGTSAGGMH